MGGGYPETGLSDISLLWMAERARKFGLEFEKDAFTGAGGWGEGDSHLPAIEPAVRAPMRDSLKGIYRLLGPTPREIGAKAGSVGEGGRWEKGISQSVAESAVLRREQEPDYAPPRLVDYLAGPYAVTTVPLEPPVPTTPAR